MPEEMNRPLPPPPPAGGSGAPSGGGGGGPSQEPRDHLEAIDAAFRRLDADRAPRPNLSSEKILGSMRQTGGQ